MLSKRKTATPKPAEPPPGPVVMLTDGMIQYLNNTRNGGNDPVPEVLQNLTALGLAGVPLVKALDKSPVDPFAYPTDQATQVIATAVGGHPVFRSGPLPGTGPWAFADFNRIRMPWGAAGYDIAAGAALLYIARYGLDRYKAALDALKPYYSE